MPTSPRYRIVKGSALLIVATVLRWVRCVPVAGVVYRRWVCSLVERSGLFDERFYLDSNADLAATGLEPIAHYVLFGDAQGRSPSPCFDPMFYRAVARAKTARAHALLHYLYVGRYLGCAPSAWFDVKYYLVENKDVARSADEPLRHYLERGFSQGRWPTPSFDGPGYLANYADVRSSGINPLVHYILEGRFQRRLTRFDDSGSGAQRSAVPSYATVESLFDSLVALAAAPTRPPAADRVPVDVVVPVYAGRMETLRCILSVLSARVQTPYELVVIDDCSPDPVIQAQLRRLASLGRITLLKTATNEGFVSAANWGMCLHPARDVVLLNADTQVFDGWLDRLVHNAQAHPRIGTVTPLSNNGSLCSYPRPSADNPYPLELDSAELDAVAARENADVEVYAPTAVGFCMYLRRPCIEDVGEFDEAAFSPGYGEENDFSLRASQRGWRHRIAADVFVWHWGARSFKGQKARYSAIAKTIIAQRYPHYRRELSAFDAADPLAVARERLDWARLRRHRAAGNTLILHHRRGGGSSRRVAAEIESLQRRGVGVYLLQPVAGDPRRVEIAAPRSGPLPNIKPIAIDNGAALRALLQNLRIDEVQTHGMVDLVPTAILHLRRLVTALGLRWVAYLHDYEVICPRINLVDRCGRYCGEPGTLRCRCCLALNGSAFGRQPIGGWRAMQGRALSAAAAIRVPDQDVAERVRRHLPSLDIEVSANDAVDDSIVPGPVRPGTADRRRHVVVIGALGRIKGFDVLLRCARDARAHGLPLRFTLLGYALDDRRLRDAGVEVSGRYVEDEAVTRLQRLAADMVWLPSICPETYSCTLSLALRCGLPVCAFDIGAVAARLRRLGMGDGLVPLAMASRPDALNRFFLGQTLRSPLCLPSAAVG
jgi:GT2 family glycosyltransferase/glycosyltransferase involved in cell wall biosynthesis